MRTTTFYRWCLLLPIVVPLLYLPLSLVEWLETLSWVMVYSVLIGGIPYAITVGCFARVFFRSNDDEKMQRAALLLPPTMTLILTCLSLSLFICLRDEAGIWEVFRSDWPFIAGLCACVLLLGYGYVLLAVCLRWLFRRVRWIS